MNEPEGNQVRPTSSIRRRLAFSSGGKSSSSMDLMLLSASEASMDTSTRELSPSWWLSFASEPSSPVICLGSMERRRYGGIIVSCVYIWREIEYTLLVPATFIPSRSMLNRASSTRTLCSTHSTTQPMPTTSGFGSCSNL